MLGAVVSNAMPHRSIEAVEARPCSMLNSYVNDGDNDCNLEDRVAVISTLHTGLRLAAAAHACTDWVITDPDDGKMLKVPKKYPCHEADSGGCSICRDAVAQREQVIADPESDKVRDDYTDAELDPTVWLPKTARAARKISLKEEWTDPATGDVERTGVFDFLLPYWELSGPIGGCSATMNNRVKRAARDAGLGDYRPVVERSISGDRVHVPDVTAHDLRATFGCNVARVTDDQYALRDLMGHKHLYQTDYYIQFVGRAAQRAMASY